MDGDMMDGWTCMAQFDVIGEPKAQPRPRATVRGKHAAVYQPKGPAKNWRADIKRAASDHAPHEPIRRQPMRVDIEWRMPRPNSHYGTGRNAGKLKASAPELHIGRPDRDNMDKVVLDAMKDAGWFVDDGQVCAGILEKRYVDAGERPGAYVKVWRRNNE